MPHKRVYTNIINCVHWHGHLWEDQDDFIGYMSGTVRKRLFDEEYTSVVKDDMRALAAGTLMDTAVLEGVLSEDPVRQPWEAGEALAECLLSDAGVTWPWNMDRDKRTPKASLPGADLIGFAKSGDSACLVLGEVKTSSDPIAPPNVMTGRSGMIHQLEMLAANRGIHFTIFKWLNARCTSLILRDMYESAVRRYFASACRDIILYGILLRDTEPDELDIRNRAVALSDVAEEPMHVELSAWYLPAAIDRWPGFAGAVPQ